VALILCGEPIAAALFGYGRFTAQDTHHTAQALAAFSVGLPSYILVKVLTPGFYARHDTATPVRFATISMGANLALNLILILPLRHMGPPLATALSSTLNVALLYTTLTKRGHFTIDARLRRRATRLVFAALAMGAVLALTQGYLAPYTHGTWFVRLAAMAVLVGGGVCVYGVASIALGAFTREDLGLLRRRRASNKS